MRKKVFSTILAAVMLSACSERTSERDPYDPAHDYFTFSYTEQFVTDSIALDLTVDFDTEQLPGSGPST